MEMASALAALQKKGFKVGIITGSDIKYIEEQCSIMRDISPVNYKIIDYYPCNGLKLYRYDKFGKLIPIYINKMSSFIGQKKYNDIVYLLCDYQSRLKFHIYGEDIPLTGNFIDCRDSIINWCPIGRNASSEQRKKWIDVDSQYSARNLILENYFDNDLFKGMTIKLGGETSFDIYPAGWNKSFVLKDLTSYDIWFVGDKCENNGNDKEIYDIISKNKNRAYQTKSVKDTIKIIKEIIKREEKTNG